MLRLVDGDCVCVPERRTLGCGLPKRAKLPKPLPHTVILQPTPGFAPCRVRNSELIKVVHDWGEVEAALAVLQPKLRS